MAESKPRDLSIFKNHTLSDLSSRSLYSEVYLMYVRQGAKPITPRFRARMVRALHKSEAVLFSA